MVESSPVEEGDLASSPPAPSVVPSADDDDDDDAEEDGEVGDDAVGDNDSDDARSRVEVDFEGTGGRFCMTSSISFSSNFKNRWIRGARKLMMSSRVVSPWTYGAKWGKTAYLTLSPLAVSYR